MPKERLAYGIIAIDPVRKKILCVQRRDTPEILLLLRGFYKEKDIEYILSRGTEEEHLLIKTILESPDKKEASNIIKEYLLERYSMDRVETFLPQSLRNFDLYRKDILDVLKIIRPKKEHDWIWPEGGLKEEESTVQCAIRETLEETGFSFDEVNLSRKKVYNVETLTFFDHLFINGHYVCLCDSEKVKAVRDFDRQEIRKVEWIPFKDFPELVGDMKYIMVFYEVLNDFSILA